MTLPPLRLAFAAVFWRVFLVTFAIQQFTAFHKTRRLLSHLGLQKKFEAFLNFSPYALVLALLVASLVAIAFDLVVRLLARPIAARWYAPRGTGSDLTPLAFELQPGETLAAEWPARIRSRLGWKPGTLIATNRALRFYPRECDCEPFTLQNTQLLNPEIQPSRPAFGSFLEGVPGSLILKTNTGSAHTLALANPQSVANSLPLV